MFGRARTLRLWLVVTQHLQQLAVLFSIWLPLLRPHQRTFLTHDYSSNRALRCVEARLHTLEILQELFTLQQRVLKSLLIRHVVRYLLDLLLVSSEFDLFHSLRKSRD